MWTGCFWVGRIVRSLSFQDSSSDFCSFHTIKVVSSHIIICVSFFLLGGILICVDDPVTSACFIRGECRPQLHFSASNFAPTMCKALRLVSREVNRYGPHSSGILIPRGERVT